MNTELLEALNILEKEKDISKETLLDAIENSLMNACKNHFGKTDNIKLIMNKELFPYGAIFVALSFVTMLFVKYGDSKPETPKSKLEMLGADD